MPLGNSTELSPPDLADLQRFRYEAFYDKYYKMLEQQVIPDRGRYHGLTVKAAAKLDERRFTSPINHVQQDYCTANWSDRRFSFAMSNPEFVFLCVRFGFASRDAFIMHNDGFTPVKASLWNQLEQTEIQNRILR